MMYPPDHPASSPPSPSDSTLLAGSPNDRWHGPPPHRGPERRGPRSFPGEIADSELPERFRFEEEVRPRPRPGPEPPGLRTFGERLEDALPLMVASIACGVIGLLLRLYSPSAASGHLEVWTLFVGLSIVSGVGATVSFLLDEDEVPEEDQKVAPSSPRTMDVPPVRRREDRSLSEPTARRAPRPSARALAEMPLADEATRAPHDDESPDLREEEERWLRPRPDYDRPLWDETEESPPPPLVPGQALEEIDRLWRDLERLRRVPSSR